MLGDRKGIRTLFSLTWSSSSSHVRSPNEIIHYPPAVSQVLYTYALEYRKVSYRAHRAYPCVCFARFRQDLCRKPTKQARVDIILEISLNRFCGGRSDWDRLREFLCYPRFKYIRCRIDVLDVVQCFRRVRKPTPCHIATELQVRIFSVSPC